MPTRNINLTEHFDTFVERQVSSGRYSNASEVAGGALRLLEAQQQVRNAKLQALRRAAEVGFEELDEGQGIAIKGKRALTRFIRDIEDEVSTE